MDNKTLDFIAKENARYYKISLAQAQKRVGVGEVKALYQPLLASQKEDNGQLTIIGGSALFHGAPLLALIVAAKVVDMVFFSCPETDKGVVNRLKSSLFSFIWIPEKEIDYYIAKSEAILIGPGLMRYRKEGKMTDNLSQDHVDGEGKRTKELTEKLIKKFPDKKWVIDAGSLQTMSQNFIPKKAILTPNRKEFEMLFGKPRTQDSLEEMAKKYDCIIVNKGAESSIIGPSEEKFIGLPQPGLTKGGTGDVTAGLIAALNCKNEPFLAASAGTFIVKLTAQRLYQKAGNYYSADDLAQNVGETIKWCLDY